MKISKLNKLLNSTTSDHNSHLSLKLIFTLIILGLIWGVMYVYPYIRYVFARSLTSALNISDTQAGLLITVYGIVSLILYVPGGILADRIRAKTPLIASMCWVLFLLLAFSCILIFINDGYVPFIAALCVWALMPFATAFVFWSSLMKAINLIGEKAQSGRCYGICFAANAIFGTIISSTNIIAYSALERYDMGFVGVTLNVALFIFIALILFTLFFHDNTNHQATNNYFSTSEIKQIISKPDIWLSSIAMMLIYMILTCTTYFTNYMIDICKVTTEISGMLTIIRTYIIMIFAAIFSGMIADKVFHSTVRWFKFASICMLISTILFFVFAFSAPRQALGIPNNVYLIAGISILPGIFSTMIYAIQFSILRDISIPAKLTGTASGICSLFVFSPDIWFNTLLGRIIDNANSANNPELGYMIIFGILTLICIGLFIICWILNKRN